MEPEITIKQSPKTPSSMTASSAADESEDWKDFANRDDMDMCPAPSIASSASSIRHRRLPPPPPSGEWSGMGRGKRPNDDDETGGIGKRLNFDIDEISLVSKIGGDTGPPQNHRALEQQRRTLIHIPPNRSDYAITYDTLLLGRNIDVYQHKIYVDTTFCSRNVLERLMGLKYEVKRCGQAEFSDLQAKLQVTDVYHFPSAIILANIDALFKNAFTQPKGLQSGESIVAPEELLYVVDIQGGPGGWVEYILSKKKWEAKVFGFSHVQEGTDYVLPESGHFPRESFEQWKGFDGIRGNGNIHRPEFVNKFAAYVRRSTNGKGAHVVLANGSLDTDATDEDKKELHIKQIALSEVLIGMKTLREGGNMILRLYDMFTPYTVGLVYLLYRTFDRITVMRPESERPASSGRYVVCQSFRQGPVTRDIVNYLANCHQTEFQSSMNYKYATEAQAEIVDLIPIEALRASTGFYDYIYNTNIDIGERQLRETDEITKKIKAGTAEYIRRYKTDIMTKITSVWGIPKMSLEVKHKNLDMVPYVRALLRPYQEVDLSRAERDGESELTNDKLQELTKPVEWHFVHVGRDRGLYISRGGDNVFKYVGGDWTKVSDDMELANNTLVYADIVDEISQYEGKQVVMTGLHIIDGLFLGGKDIRMLPYTERMDYCTKFAASMHKPMKENVIYIRAKKARELTHIAESFLEVHRRQVLGRGDRKKKPLVPVYGMKEGASSTPHYALTGYLLFRTMRDNSAHTDFLQTMNNRLFFPLTDTMNLDPKAQPMSLPENAKVYIDAATLVHKIQSLA